MRWRHRFPLQRGGHLTEEALSSRLDRVLAPREREAVDRHLAHCDGCRARLEGLERTVSLLRALPQEPVPRPFTLPEKASVPVPSARLLRLGTALAGLLLAALVALDRAGVGGPPPSPEAPLPLPTPAPAPLAPAQLAPSAALRAERGEAPSPMPTPEPAPPQTPRRPFLRWWPAEAGLALALLALLALLGRARRELREPRRRL